MTTAFKEMQRYCNQRDLAAREWKKKGGKIVGYFCDSVPEEMILAAGFFPVRLSGNPEGGTDVARKHIIPRFAAREEFVHSILNMLLTGAYDFLDYLIIPHARDSVHRLYQLLVNLKTTEPELGIPVLFFLDTLHTTFFSSGMYERDRMIEFKKTLEDWSGKKITNNDLSQAVKTTNQNKKLLKQMATFRITDPPRISGAEALKIIGASMVMLKNDHNRLLKSFLEEEVEKLPERKGKRIFVSGSPLDHSQLYDIVESDNAIVVGEDHCWGNRYSDGPIDTTPDALEAIIDRYHFRPPCSRMFPMSRRIEFFLQAVKESGAQQVVFFIYKHDEAEAWEVPEKIKALAKKGIPAVTLKNQPYRISDPEKLKTDIHEHDG